jgi:hypothetical protein
MIPDSLCPYSAYPAVNRSVVARRISTRAIRGVGELNEILGSSVAAVGGGDASVEQPGGRIVISLKGDVT